MLQVQIKNGGQWKTIATPGNKEAAERERATAAGCGFQVRIVGGVEKILIINHAGSGFSVLTTMDGIIWMNAIRRRTLNGAEVETRINRLQMEWPDAAIRHTNENCIPLDWAKEGCRVI